MSCPRVLSSAELKASDAKWITLKKITWQDSAGTERIWESAERKTRSSTGVDAVAILAILRSETKAFPLSTIVIEQYRPPIDKFIIELPAGLIDQGETAEEAAIRELQEETGYRAESILDSSPHIVSDPGMTNANMKLVFALVPFADTLVKPKANPDQGEFIVTRVVELAKLKEILTEYDNKGFVIDARLHHFAAGYDMARRLARGEFGED